MCVCACACVCVCVRVRGVCAVGTRARCVHAWPPQSSAMHLFLPCANAEGNCGANRDVWVPNPAANRPIDLQMCVPPREWGECICVVLRPNWCGPLPCGVSRDRRYAFLGKLMVRARACALGVAWCDVTACAQGYALRNKEYIGLRLAPLVWKGLLKEPLTTGDLFAVDEHTVRSMA